ncbi:MAG TPA: MFS transporter [Syntrophales bacterium]|nr:MFS transporter [Syntrophales bacterium]HNS53610.1 MFS transporter [Syntrophales bacterium]
MENEKKIILFPVASHFLFHFHEIAFPALAIPLTLSLNMSLEDVLALGFPMYLLFGLCALPWGFFADRFGNRLALAIGFFGCAAGSFLTAFSSTPSGIMGSLALIGAFACVCHPAGMGLISHGAKNRGAALGLFSVAGTVGLIAGPFLAGLMNWLAGWKVAYALMGAVSVLWGAALLFVGIDETPVMQENASGGGTGGDGFSAGTVILFFWIVTLGGLVYRINIVALPAFLEFKAGFLAAALHEMLDIPAVAATTTMAAASLTSLIYVAGIFGQLWGGRIADRRELKRLYIAFNAAILPLALLMAYLTEQALVAAAAAYVFFALGIQPIENSLIAAFTPPRRRSAGYGLAAILIFGVGALAVYLVGWVSTRWSLGTVYLFSSALLALIIANIALLLAATRGRDLRNRR